MSRIYDEEDLLKAVQLFVKTNLNTNIYAINVDKADFTIDQIDALDKNYVFSGELLEIPNHPFVNFSIDQDIEVKSNHNDKISVVNIQIEVVFDNPKKPNTYFKSLRYMRALYQTILDFASSTNEVDEMQVVKAIPMSVTTATGRQLVISGVSISVALG